ncbi:MAG: RNA polymerase sigma factor, partial [Gammaproteobacteria bacterium]|nr:RNA polymerase sigma factor [Gammaproteobacteria bacterium]
EIVAQAIDNLSDMQRAVLKLHEFDGLEFMDICNILEINESNCRVLLHRARLKVWAAIDQYHRGEV